MLIHEGGGHVVCMRRRRGREGRMGNLAPDWLKGEPGTCRETLKPAPLFYRERKMLHNKLPPKLSGLK